MYSFIASITATEATSSTEAVRNVSTEATSAPKRDLPPEEAAPHEPRLNHLAMTFGT